MALFDFILYGTVTILVAVLYQMLRPDWSVFQSWEIALLWAILFATMNRHEEKHR